MNDARFRNSSCFGTWHFLFSHMHREKRLKQAKIAVSRFLLEKKGMLPKMKTK